MPAQALTSTTQLFLDIHDITNNMVIMKNGTTSIILTIDAMNFGLLAEEEQDGIIYAYAGLLNSLNYPIQIVIHSQTKDVTHYLTLLKEQEDLASSSHIQKRIRTYREFVGNLIHERNVLDKKFYCVIPAPATELGLVAPSNGLPGSSPLDLHTYERSVIVEKARSVLEPKRDHLIAQFARIGLFARELETQEIIQLFYISYNPEAAEGQEITDSSNYTTPLVKASTPQDLSTAPGVPLEITPPQPSPAQEPINTQVDQLTPQTPQTLGQNPGALGVPVQQPPAPAPSLGTPLPPTRIPEQLDPNSPVQLDTPTPLPTEDFSIPNIRSTQPITTPDNFPQINSPAPNQGVQHPEIDLQKQINSSLNEIGAKPPQNSHPTNPSTLPPVPEI